MIIDKPGTYKISFEDYLQDCCPLPSLTRTTIKDLLFRSPCHAFYGHSRLNPDYQAKEAERFDIGTAAHALFLDGVDVIEVINADNWRTKATKDARDEARTKGKIPLLTAQTDNVFAMVNVAAIALANSELAIKSLREEGDSELTYIWTEGKAWCRCRPDWISKERTLILDYKTTAASAHPEEYNKVAVSTGLDIQDVFYRRGVKAIEGTEPAFVFMIQEIEPPYLCSFVRLDTLFLEMGEEKVERGIKLWRKCLSSGIWPGYTNQIYIMEAPAWSLASWEIRKLL